MQLFHFDPHARATQRCYRILLQALSRPGCLYSMDFSTEHTLFPSKVPPPLAAAACTLLDDQTTLGACGPEAASWARSLALATGAREGPLTEADYVLCRSVPEVRDLEATRRGTLLVPEDGATLFVWIQSRIEGKAGTIEISGPGVETRIRLGVASPVLQLVERRRAVPYEYPMGNDFFVFGSEGLVLGLPRTASVRVLMERES